jgi:hypothetical protein
MHESILASPGRDWQQKAVLRPAFLTALTHKVSGSIKVAAVPELTAKKIHHSNIIKAQAPKRLEEISGRHTPPLTSNITGKKSNAFC